MANAEVKEWCLTTAGQRKHGTTHQKPLVVFEQTEKAALKGLPSTPYDLTIWKEVRLHRDCYIVFENAFYSAPFRLIGQKLRVRAGATSLKLYSPNYELVATHTRATQAGERVTNPQHLPPYKLDGLNQTREGVQAEADGIGPATSQTVKTMLADAALDQLPSAGRLVRLARQFGADRLEAACERANRFGEADYRTVKAILTKGLEESESEFTATATAQLKTARGNNPAELKYARSASELLGHLFGLGSLVTSAAGVMLGLVGSVIGGYLAWN